MLLIPPQGSPDVLKYGAADFLQDPEVRQWLDGIEPAWMLLTFNSLRALR